MTQKQDKPVTPGMAVRQMCLQCLGAGTAATAFDCRSHLCPLYACHPFRGRSREDVKVLSSEEGLPPKKQASRALCRKMCYECQDHRSDCNCTSCPIFPFRPFQPSKGRRDLTDEQREKLAERGRALQLRLAGEGKF